MLAQPPETHVPTTAAHPSVSAAMLPSLTPSQDAATSHNDEAGRPAGAAPYLLSLPSLDLSTERLDAQDSLLLGGRPLAELSDTELASTARGMCAEPPAEQPVVRNQRNWLKLRVQWPQRRVHVHLRADESVLDWFRRGGPGFQGRINAVLRAYVDAQVEAEQRAR